MRTILTSSAAPFLRQAPEGQSAAADGTDIAAQQDGAMAQPEIPADPQNPNAAPQTEQPAEKAPETSDEQAPEPPAANDSFVEPDRDAMLADVAEMVVNLCVEMQRVSARLTTIEAKLKHF